MVHLRHRKGLLATVTTILIALPLILLVLVTTNNIRITQTEFAVTETGPTMAYYIQDITHDHDDLLGWTPSTANNSWWVNFSGIGTLSTNWRARFDDYGSILKEDYGPKLNIIINISGTPMPANITPMDYSIDISDDILITPGSGTPWENISEIVVSLTVSKDRAHIISNITPIDSGGIPVHVHINDPDGSPCLDDNTATLDPLSTNVFSAAFDDGSSVSVGFGQNDGIPGSLAITSDLLSVNVTLVALRFGLNVTPALETGSTAFVQAPGGLNKTSKITLGIV